MTPHRIRFGALALALFALAGTAVGAALELAGRPDPVKRQLFSDWIPTATTSDQVVPRSPITSSRATRTRATTGG